jgi:hypothetical protein
MTSRKSHVQKTKNERQHYWDYIESRDHESTKSEALDFNATTQGGEETSLFSPTSRPINFTDQVKEHFKKNWITWLVYALLSVLIWLMGDSKIDIAKIETKVEYSQDQINEIKGFIKKIEDKNNAQDLDIRDNQNNIEFLKNHTRKYE